MLKKPVQDALGYAVSLWFRQPRTLGVPVPVSVLQEKAVQLNKKLNGSDSFSGSKGWLEKLKNCHGIRQLAISGEKLSGDTDNAADFIKKFLFLFIQKIVSHNNL